MPVANFAWTRPWPDVASDDCPARVAELADAVDSKSTDESLVGSTPTPGTTFRGGHDIGNGKGTESADLPLLSLGMNPNVWLETKRSGYRSFPKSRPSTQRRSRF